MLTADLRDKAVLVTGGASGIGLATVERFARCGAVVAMNHLADDPRGAQAIARLQGEGLRVVGAPGDVAQPAAASKIVAAALEGTGKRLDFLINCAGTPGGTEPYSYDDLDAMTDPFWDKLMQVNLIGMFRVTRAAKPALVAAKGAVVNIASVAGLHLRGSSLVYAATKAGVISITVALARALAPEVRVNAIAPGLVDSPWTKSWPEQRKRNSVKRTLLGRMAKPEDIADGALYLCAGTSFVTAQTLVIDGGLIHGDEAHALKMEGRL
ncbi:MAG TPA: SDR family oxidoreductase [Candidatus Sulfotelmatobacter sp.]|nr:SDR family oxidoreductase [Candidatus Sulfotelmatobacter sp.]